MIRLDEKTKSVSYMLCLLRRTVLYMYVYIYINKINT